MPAPTQDKRSKQRQELDRKQRNLQEKDEIEEVENMQFEDNEDDYTLARSKVEPDEVSSRYNYNGNKI